MRKRFKKLGAVCMTAAMCVGLLAGGLLRQFGFIRPRKEDSFYLVPGLCGNGCGSFRPGILGGTACTIREGRELRV